MSRRLPIDSNLIGYWGFDEANANDPAIDDASGGNDLTVSNSTGVIVGRVGNARRFNGTSTSATPASSVSFRLSGTLTIMVWEQLQEFNSSGSQLRTILACDGATANEVDNTQYSLAIDNSGRLVYSHDRSTGQPTIVKSDVAIKIGRTHFIQVRRSDAGGGQQNVEFFVDGQSVDVFSVTVNGAPSSLPIDPPTGGGDSTLKVGISDKANDSWWFGTLDEVSIHDTARAYHSYLLDAYFRAASSDTFRVSNTGNVKHIGGVDLGNGCRWWAYERDRSIYVVREHPFGMFTPEVWLSSSGGTSPAGTTIPELCYDPASDTLLVVFMNSGRIYKVTAGADDTVTTQPMPVTSDTSGIIKCLDQFDAVRLGSGATQEDSEQDYKYPATPSIAFTNHPSFGIAIPYSDTNQAYGGYKVYKFAGGANVLLGTATQRHLIQGYPPLIYHFYPISTRVEGERYYARGVGAYGELGPKSNAIIDNFGKIMINEVLAPDRMVFNEQGEVPDGPAKLGTGGGIDKFETITTTARTVIKIPAVEPATLLLGSGGPTPEPLKDIYYINRGVIKMAVVESSGADFGTGGGLGLRISGGSVAPQGKYTT